MRTFHAGGKDWSVGIGARRLREIQAVTGRTLASADGGLLLAIYTDPLIAYEALAVLLKEQAADRGVSEDALSDMLVGDVLGRARRVLADELIDFEPLADRREAMRAMLGRLDKLETAMVDRIRAGVENIDPEALADELLKGGNDGP